jgi:hypothetical protein
MSGEHPGFNARIASSVQAVVRRYRLLFSSLRSKPDESAAEQIAMAFTFPKWRATVLARLLRFELIELSLLPLDLGLLHLHPPLHVFVLLLPRLHLIADERAPDKTDRRSDAGPGPRVSGRAADDGTQSRASQRPNGRALFPRC